MTFEDVERMHRMKTGALLKASVLMGALSGQATLLTESTREALARYGDAIGLAFQVVDDILDVEASSADLGKTAGKDAAHGKPTYVSVLGIEAAKAWSLRLRAQALEALNGMARQRPDCGTWPTSSCRTQGTYETTDVRTAPERVFAG